MATLQSPLHPPPFNYFWRSCKDKLNTLEILKREDQKLFLDAVFGIDEKAVLESNCKNYLEERLKSVQSLASDSLAWVRERKESSTIDI